MRINRKRLTDEVRRLVRIPSHEEVDTVAAYVLGRLQDAGVHDAHRDEDGNVVGSLGEGDGLLLNAHLDTVGVDGFDGPPFDGRREGTRLIGRGASDCKAGVATLLELARVLARAQLKRKVLFAFSVWEEGSSPGPNGAFGLARRVRAQQGVVLESTVRPPERMDVLAGCRGILRADFIVAGKAAHSSTPHRGDNALYRAAELVGRFREDFSPEHLPCATVSVLGRRMQVPCIASLTEIRATQGRNIIPAQCVVGLDCRLFPGQDAEELVARLRRFAAGFGRGKVRLEERERIPGHVCTDAGLLDICRRAAAGNGYECRIRLGNGRTDSTVFHNEGGIPTVVFGPGTEGQAHTRTESLDLPSFHSAAQACLDAVLALGA